MDLEWWQYDLRELIRNGISFNIDNVDEFIAFFRDCKDAPDLLQIEEKWMVLDPQLNGSAKLYNADLNFEFAPQAKEYFRKIRSGEMRAIRGNATH